MASLRKTSPTTRTRTRPAAEPRDGAPPFERVAHGDCLEQLETLQRFGPYQLIYVDPPFNAGGLRRAREGLVLSAAGKATLSREEQLAFIQRLTAAVEAGDGSALAMLEAIREDNVQRLGIAEICH